MIFLSKKVRTVKLYSSTYVQVYFLHLFKIDREIN